MWYVMLLNIVAIIVTTALLAYYAPPGAQAPKWLHLWIMASSKLTPLLLVLLVVRVYYWVSSKITKSH